MGGESAAFTGRQRRPGAATSGRLTTNKLPRSRIAASRPRIGKDFSVIPLNTRSLASLALRPFYIYLRPPRDAGCLPGHSPPGRTKRLQRSPQPGSAGRRCISQVCRKQGDIKRRFTEGFPEPGRFRNATERPTGRSAPLRTQNKLHRLQKAFVLGLRAWPASQR